MNVQRAKEISEKGEQMYVTFEGTQVLIQHVDEESETARIYSKENVEDERDVPVLALKE
ncbi:H-type small acid-soluble spore protein [Cytobacillus sp. S13-E01]|uniref:H-type small acid-soluble spore protein n=1 Tax=Cytobacillus sp. S13-E01 TaxID=3031326 RepID=UPI0023D88D84|nr:H-type small acid-soluble spore protein [Cytobacillus sp. S13-E01]MDF0725648.1 H-type small acid-soluble spore protein [Cytobacillus sp. S13-E01]